MEKNYCCFLGGGGSFIIYEAIPEDNVFELNMDETSQLMLTDISLTSLQNFYL